MAKPEPSEQDIRDVLTASGPLSRKDMQEALEVANAQLAKPLGNLGRAGEIEVDDSTDPWLYRLAADPAKPGA